MLLAGNDDHRRVGDVVDARLGVLVVTVQDVQAEGEMMVVAISAPGDLAARRADAVRKVHNESRVNGTAALGLALRRKRHGNQQHEKK